MPNSTAVNNANILLTLFEFEAFLTVEIDQRNIKPEFSIDRQREQRAIQYERVCDSTNSATKTKINYLPMP